MRVGIPINKTNMATWGLFPDNEDVKCNCEVIQDPKHLRSMLDQQDARLISWEWQRHIRC